MNPPAGYLAIFFPAINQGTRRHLRVAAILSVIGFLWLFAESAFAQVNLVVNSSLCFKDMDNNPLYDEDAIAGQITLTSLVIQAGGKISYNDPGNACSDAGVPNDGAQPVKIIVSGNMEIQAGGSINTENKIQAGNAGNITLLVGGTFVMKGPSGPNAGGLITSSNLTATSGGINAGDILIQVAGDVTLEPGSTIKGNSFKGRGGTIEITGGNDIDIDGDVLSQSGGTGAGCNPGYGGFISITAVRNLLISDDGIVSSRGLDPGADLVHLCACNVTIYGLVESTGAGHGIPSCPPNHLNNAYRPDKPSNSTAGVEVWASNLLLIDNLNHNGEINADLCCGGGTTGTSWIDLFSQGSIVIIGGATVDEFAVHANGKAGTNDNGGVVTVKSTGGNITANGFALQADATVAGGSGGSIVIEASNTVSLGGAKIYARGDFNPTGGLGKGGNVNIRSFTDAITWSGGIGDVNPTGTGQATVANRGVITFKKCTAGAVDVTGTTFPFLGGAATTPTTFADACVGLPTLQSYVVFCECPVDCYGSITIIKVLVGTPPAGPWEYTSNIPGHLSFTLPATGGSVTFTGIPNGSYTVTETNQLVPVANIPYEVSNSCGTGAVATMTITDCDHPSCTFTNRDPSFCQWCTKSAVLSQVRQNIGDNCSQPDIIVDVRLGITPVDPNKVATDQPATGSLQAAIDYMNAHPSGDFNGDGKLFIGVIATDCQPGLNICQPNGRPAAGDTPFGTENVIVTNMHAARLNIFGCSVTMKPADPSKPVMTIQNSIGKVTVLDIHVKNSNAEGYLIKDNADLVVVKNSRAMYNDIGYRVQDDDVQITGAPQISNNRIGILIEGGPNNILRTNSDIRDNSEVGIRITGSGNESNGNEVGVSGKPNLVGMEVSGNSNDLHDDNISYNTGNGLVVSGNMNHVEGEDAQYNGGNGMLISGNSNVVIKNNQVKYNKADGIRVTGNSNSLQENVTESNTGNGINASNGATGNTLKKNQAKKNGLQGIRACGQVDLGDNVGESNGLDPQVDFVCADPLTSKFFVVDISADKGFKYDGSLNLISGSSLAAANSDASDVATNGANTFVLDKSDKQVYRYVGAAAVSRVLKDNVGSSLSNPSGIAIDGDEMWVVDDSKLKIYRYSLAAAFGGSGNINALQVITLNGAAGNGSAEGLAIDATYLYVLDDGDKQFYRYVRATGAYSAVSKIMKEVGGGSLSTPSGAVLDGASMWIVDKGKDKAYQYSFAGLFSASGNLNASAQYTLYSSNTDATGIAVGTASSLPKADYGEDQAEPTTVPTDYTLFQNYPNPFNPTTTIRFSLPEPSRVKLSVYNVLGQEVSRLVDDVLGAGHHEVVWDNLANSGYVQSSGVYFYSISAVSSQDGRQFTEVKKMLLLK